MTKSTAYMNFLQPSKNGWPDDAGNIPLIRNKPPVPANAPLPGQVRNAAGGYTWKVNDGVLMERLLGLGTEKGSFYKTPAKLTADAAAATIRNIRKDGRASVDLIRAWAMPGRAVTVSPQLFALALASSEKYADKDTRNYALLSLPIVARTLSHLLEFTDLVTANRGWGRGLTDAIDYWLEKLTDDNLAYQMAKYRNRDGWNIADVLKSVHPKPRSATRDSLYAYAIFGGDFEKVPDDGRLNFLREKVMRGVANGEGPWRIIQGYELARRAATVEDVLRLIRNYKLSWEMVPQKFLKERSVWEALLPHMPPGALIRNLGRMTSLGMLNGYGENETLVVAKLLNEKAIKSARIHPIKTFADMKRYGLGHGDKGDLRWTPNRRVLDALTETIYLSFPNVVPMGETMVLGVDLSGSMAGSYVNGVAGVTAYEAAGLMALAVARTEPNAYIMGYDDTIQELNITPHMRLDEVVHHLETRRHGGTACELPMVWAKNNGIRAGIVWNFTDSGDWAGKRHAADAIVEYRKWTNMPSRMFVCDMVANDQTIGDPHDELTGRCIGVDSLILDRARAFSVSLAGEKVDPSTARFALNVPEDVLSAE